MSAPLGTAPAVGRQVWYRRAISERKPDWLPAEVLRVRPNGKVDLQVTTPSSTTFRAQRVSNGIKPGQWCGWADDLWLPRDGGELGRTA